MSIRDTEMRSLSKAERILYFWESKGIYHDEEYKQNFRDSGKA